MKKPEIALAVLILLTSFVGIAAAAENRVKDVEITKMSVIFSKSEFPPVAYLCLDLKNNGDKNIANLNLEVTYYDKGGYLIKKVALKNRLIESLPLGEEKKYKIRLNGDVFNVRNEEYPYSMGEDVGEFDVKVLNVKLGRK